ncbi:hypothetical protein AMTRI_Chr11g153730 [Amborella trichopoda]|uniref:ABC transporter domain-containing protein n=1 Tax=Amborella trichopoda TaxID=13333 RepID=U5D2F1_AMBTC|nr:ABC transporter G family member 5 [Amborella trichopoda]ERN16594.1 hypothetical protein AMTR_s00031p00236610 [Amborella trichopoda]|eukprot:XP_006855127.1 ABC transporter G family member 5 [Amborella trichopoda]
MKQGFEIEARNICYQVDITKSSSKFRDYQETQEGGDDHLEKNAEEGEIKHEIKKQRSTRQVLNNVSCRAKPWELLAIVGPSGAGKSTLLEILAGRRTPSKATCSLLVNQKPVVPAHFRKISGFVPQKDTLFPLLTVEETLMFSAGIRLSLSNSERYSKVVSLLQELGLYHVAKTRVGNENIRGISGGERRRVSIGVDVIHDPAVLLLDEPTSGLDSNAALQIIDMLKSMAELRGRTVILSIHQPGFRIIKLFNSILMLANGSVYYQGTTEQLQSHMMSLGLGIPLHVNILEFAIEAIDKLKPLEFRDRDDEEADEKRVTLQQLFQSTKVIERGSDEFLKLGFANSRVGEIWILAMRFSKNIFRTKELFAMRTLQMLIAGLVLGSIFPNLREDRTGAEERVGLFAFVLTFLLSSTTEALPIFLQEREILMKETSCGSYRISSYSVANALVFLPFLLILALLFSTPLYWMVGLSKSMSSFLFFVLIVWLILYTANSVVVCFSALVPNFIIGNSVISGVMGFFFLFSGYFISKNGIPRYWLFMHYISLFKYPFEGFLINEFSSVKHKCLEYEFGECLLSGKDLLREEGLEDCNRWSSVGIMVCIILAYRFISFLILQFRCSLSDRSKSFM